MYATGALTLLISFNLFFYSALATHMHLCGWYYIYLRQKATFLSTHKYVKTRVSYQICMTYE